MNFKIEVFHDNHAENPFEEWDCNPPITVNYSRDTKEYQKYDILIEIENKLTKGMISKHLHKIVAILEFDLEFTKVYGYTVEERNDAIRSEINNLDLEDLAKLCDILKIPYEFYTSKGYSQSDWADVLIVLTEDFFKKTGANPKDSEAILKSTSKLFDQWAWGDVYGFTLYEKVNFTKTYENGQKVESFEWKEIDSCTGFYGREWEENGLMDYIPEEAKYLLEDIEVTY